MAGAAPACAARAGAGVIRGYAFTGRARTHPSGNAPVPGAGACPGARMPAQVQRGRGRPGPHPRARSRTALRTARLPRARRAHRVQRVLSLIFTAGHLKNSLAIPRVALFVSFELFFYLFFFKRGAKPRNYFLAILH